MLNRFHWSLSSKVFWGIAVFLLAVGVTPSHSKIFKWKDDKGKVHFTDDISKIPFKYRNRDKTKTLKGGPVDVPKPSFLLPEEEHKAHVIQVKAIPGGHYMVEVLINGEIPANLMVDTGATMVMLSEDLGQKLGVNQDPSLPQMKFNTAGGMMESPLFVLDSIKIGKAVVPYVEASTSPHFSGVDGLLGMNFLGEFKMELDREKSQLILKPLGEPDEQMWEGRNAAWWKQKYHTYAQTLQRLDRASDHFRTDFKKLRHIKKLIKHYKKLHSALDSRADRAGVPQRLRSYP